MLVNTALLLAAAGTGFYRFLAGKKSGRSVSRRYETPDEGNKLFCL
jgi:hypothetical protein